MRGRPSLEEPQGHRSGPWWGAAQGRRQDSLLCPGLARRGSEEPRITSPSFPSPSPLSCPGESGPHGALSTPARVMRTQALLSILLLCVLLMQARGGPRSQRLSRRWWGRGGGRGDTSSLRRTWELELSETSYLDHGTMKTLLLPKPWSSSLFIWL